MKLPKLLSSSVLLRETKSDQLKALSYKLKKKNPQKPEFGTVAGSIHYLIFQRVSAYAGFNSSIVGFPAL